MKRQQAKVSFTDLPDILVREDLVKVLPYSESYLKKILCRGMLPSKKLGRRHIILKKDFIQWLENLV